jgi:hypothetical protein
VIHLSRYPVHFTVQYEDAMFAYGKFVCLVEGYGCPSLLYNTD